MLTLSNCKINIGLNITRRRPEGYHDISTCMLPVPWHDIIEIVPAHADTPTLVTLGRAIDCPQESNLVMKAYRALSECAELPAVDIVLEKIVPDGAGLGGGSSDASHTLLLLNEIFDLNKTHEELAHIAARVGADCPFFVYNRPMLCEGTGDIMTPIDLPLTGYTIVIAKPEGVSISTAQAYAGVKPSIPETPLAERLKLPVSQWQEVIVNDFERSIFPQAPQIADLKTIMLDSGAIYASMSGSGASVYGIFDNDILADGACKKVDDLPHFSFKIQS